MKPNWVIFLLIVAASCAVNERRREPRYTRMASMPTYAQATTTRPQAQMPAIPTYDRTKGRPVYGHAMGKPGLTQALRLPKDTPKTTQLTKNRQSGDQPGQALPGAENSASLAYEEAMNTLTPMEAAPELQPEVALQRVPPSCSTFSESEECQKPYVYRYYPDAEIYWNQSNGTYIVYQNGSWVTMTSWPTYIRTSPFYVSLGVHTRMPWYQHHIYRSRYPRRHFDSGFPLHVERRIPHRPTESHVYERNHYRSGAHVVPKIPQPHRPDVRSHHEHQTPHPYRPEARSHHEPKMPPPQHHPEARSHHEPKMPPPQRRPDVRSHSRDTSSVRVDMSRISPLRRR